MTAAIVRRTATMTIGLGFPIFGMRIHQKPFTCGNIKHAKRAVPTL